MIEPAALLAWTALALAATLSPGPDTLLVASHAARGGLRAGLAAAAGIVAGGLWYASLFGFGLLSVLVAVPALFLTVKIVGALYLAWLGFGLLRNALTKQPREAPPESAAGLIPSVAPRATAPPSRGSMSQPFMQAFLTNALNPKVALFYLAVLPQFASGPNAPAIGVLLIAIHYATAAIWMPCIAFAASRARKISWNRTFVRWLEGAIGAFFVGVAGRLALAQAR